MTFKTIRDLNYDIVKNIHLIPSDIDLVIGIPRSGMIVASIISVYINKPLIGLEAFENNMLGTGGMTKNRKGWKTSFDDVKKILVVEDSVNSGRSISLAKDKLCTKYIGKQFLFLGAYITRESKKLVDIYFDIFEHPRVFEWNYIHNELLSKACMDIDGVLCLDPTEEQNDDGVKYRQFIENAPIKLLPTRRVGYIVTSRLEKYRSETELWLSQNGVEYGELIMMDCATADERRKLGNHGAFKAEIFSKLPKAIWFIESNVQQAMEIASKSHKIVFCVDNQTVYGADSKLNLIENRKASIRKAVKSVLPKSIVVLYKKLKGR